MKIKSISQSIAPNYVHSLEAPTLKNFYNLKTGLYELTDYRGRIYNTSNKPFINLG